MSDPELRQLAYKLQREDERRRLRKSFVGNGGLLRFVKHFWHVLEPQTPFVDGWPLEAICLHLEAVSYGEIKRLLINVPPGFCKSLLVDVFWPAWEWATIGPHLRYVTFSYSSLLTERDNRRFGALVSYIGYQELYGDTVKIVKLGDRIVSNRATGWKLASSVGGVGTGERGNRVICLPFSERILTDLGYLPIGRIVTERLPVRIWGMDEKSGECGWQEIEKYECNPTGPIYEIAFDGGAIRCTGDHPVFVEGRGYIRADAIEEGQSLRTLLLHEVRSGDLAQAECSAEVLLKAVPLCVRERGGQAAQQSPVLNMWEDGLSGAGTSIANSWKHLLQPQMPWSKQHWSIKSGLCSGISHAYLRLVHNFVRRIDGAVQGSRMLLSLLCLQLEVGAWAYSRPIAQSSLSGMRSGVQGSESRDRVLFSEMRGYSSFGEDEGRGQRALYSRRSGQALSARMEQATQGNHSSAGRYGLSALFQSARRAIGIACPSHQLRQDRSAPRELDNALSVLPRQDAWPSGPKGNLARSVVNSVKCLGVIEAETFNLRVSPHHNYFAEGILLHNCDDPHNVKESESEIVRTETVRWRRESMSNRLNDMERDVIVIIMQRVHGDDVSGDILARDHDYVHLMIPMEYDVGRQVQGSDDPEPGMPYRTSIGWYDPRYDEADDIDALDGLLAWEERFPPSRVEIMKTEGGPYFWSGQYQQTPSPRGGGIFKREWWQLWESADGKFPVFDYVLASLDSAFTEQERNDPSALTIWGIFQNQEGYNRGMLVHAWRKHLEFSGPRTPMLPNESKGQWIVRTQPKWGLMEWVKHTCERFKVDNLLIEAKASGMSAAQELRNRYGRLDFGVQLCPVKGSKEARAYAAQPTFSQGLIYAPARDWADDVISEMEAFPKHKYADLTDSSTQAIKFMRDAGLLNTEEEARAMENEELAEGLRRHKSGGVASRYFD